MNYIESLLLKHDIKYWSSGGDFVVSCLNPDHDDNNPSMRIDRNIGMFNCLSCNFGGQLNKLLEILGESKPTQTTFLTLKASKLKDLLKEIQKEKLLLPEDRCSVTLETFNNISKEILLKHGAFTSKEENYLGRLWVPIYQYGNLRFIIGRSLNLGSNNRTKYKIYPKHTKLDFLFNLEKTNCPTIVLVEGLFDYLRLKCLGIKNICPIFGATSFQLSHVKQLQAFNIMGVISMLDNDDAGNKGSSRIKNLCDLKGLYFERFEPKTDPGDLVSIQELDMLCIEQGFKIQEHNLIY